MPENNIEIMRLLPFMILGGSIVVSLVIEMFSKKSMVYLPALSIIAFLATGLLSLQTFNESVVIFGGTMQVGGQAAIFSFIFNIAAIIVTLNSVNYLKKYGAELGEFYILMQSSILGMMVMASAKDLFTVFIGLELMSICFYVLAGLNRKRKESNEAALKYFLLGAFATGFIVYGIALIYGMVGSTSIEAIIYNFYNLSDNLVFLAGIALFLVGFSFKIAVFPFHMWVPDVYQGSATTVTGLMSTTGKSAAFSVILIILSAVFAGNVANKFAPYFATVAVASMLLGSIVAIAQKNLKRMLAYSSIAHAGYMSIGLAAGNPESVAGIIFYLAAYVFMNLGAFGVIAVVEGENDKFVSLDSYAGLGKKNPMLAAFMALFMFALAGIPPMAGFFGKYYVFLSAIKSDLTWLALVGVLSSVISVYFYIRVVIYMYFKDVEDDFVVKPSLTGYTAIFISGLLVLFFGLMPEKLMNLITATF